jgi:hypothetical protein
MGSTAQGPLPQRVNVYATRGNGGEHTPLAMSGFVYFIRELCQGKLLLPF